MRTLIRSPFMGLFDELFDYSLALMDGNETPTCKCNCCKDSTWKETKEGYKLFIKGENVKIAVNDKERTLSYRVRDFKDETRHYKDATVSFPEDALLDTVKATRKENYVHITVKKKVEEEPKLEGREIVIN